MNYLKDADKYYVADEFGVTTRKTYKTAYKLFIAVIITALLMMQFVKANDAYIDDQSIVQTTIE